MPAGEGTHSQEGPPAPSSPTSEGSSSLASLALLASLAVGKSGLGPSGLQA